MSPQGSSSMQMPPHLEEQGTGHGPSEVHTGDMGRTFFNKYERTKQHHRKNCFSTDTGAPKSSFLQLCCMAVRASPCTNPNPAGTFVLPSP